MSKFDKCAMYTFRDLCVMIAVRFIGVVSALCVRWSEKWTTPEYHVLDAAKQSTRIIHSGGSRISH